MNKIKKIFYIITLLIFITGCDVEYNIKINEFNEITESFNINKLSFNNELEKEYIVNFYKIGDEYKKYYIKNIDNIYNAKYTYKNIEDYKNNSEFSANINYDIKGTKYEINYNVNLSDYLLPDVNDASVTGISNINYVITLPFTVIDTNGKKIDDNKYMWEFNEDNYEQNIYIKYDTNMPIYKETSFYILIFLVLGLLFIGYANIYVLKKMK